MKKVKLDLKAFLASKGYRNQSIRDLNVTFNKSKRKYKEREKKKEKYFSNQGQFQCDVPPPDHSTNTPAIMNIIYKIISH